MNCTTSYLPYYHDVVARDYSDLCNLPSDDDDDDDDGS